MTDCVVSIGGDVMGLEVMTGDDVIGIVVSMGAVGVIGDDVAGLLVLVEVTGDVVMGTGVLRVFVVGGCVSVDAGVL